MLKLGTLIVNIQALCFSHGDHLAVMDVLYKKKEETDLESDDEDSGFGDEDLEDVEEAADIRTYEGLKCLQATALRKTLQERTTVFLAQISRPCQQ